MIVRPGTTSVLLITQPDHAALARRMMEAWGGLSREARRASILRAIGEHDNGWKEPDASPGVDPAHGRILDFMTAPVSVRQGVWRRGVARLASDPWAAALVSQHALTLYERYRPEAEWARFFGDLESERGRLLEAAGLTLDLLRRDYTFLRIGDLASLTFCSGWTDEQRCDGVSIRLEGTRLVIAPDPFGGRDVPLEVAARELPSRAFASDADARQAFETAPLVSLSGLATGA